MLADAIAAFKGRRVLGVIDRVCTSVRLPYAPLWRQSPVTVGGVTSMEMGRLLFGRKAMSVHVFIVGDTIVDTGLACMAAQVS